jgi:pSer/pThr/pTyr-binding forkhead associated (FHA) protein
LVSQADEIFPGGTKIMAKLCLLNENGDVAEEWDLGEKPIAVGRGPAADVKIDDEGLSRRHFLVYREGDDYVVKDLSSRNGTWVTGIRMQNPTPLRHKDFIVAGRTRFRFWGHAFPPPPPGALFGPHDTVVIPVPA